ncbi:sugar transferase [uncultured Tenacibaculum sp.]|uniref:sugar transferase n=1 Tax=uncultured Tenacibaculum sp. TaxID=174713 RepID=UPI0026101949|nr:sugar transferase [uncultured Tenacibaculum sp.]
MYSLFFKRVLDFLFSLIGLLVFSPVFVIVYILLSIANQGKPFFFQKRPGKNERFFSIIKFKTMNDKKDSEGNLLPDKDRLTKIGVFVRKTSLDEIPQLINVLKGDMSLIGPRPLLPEYLELYNMEQKKRHNVKPGITGWAQINGRNDVSWKKKFELDVWYVNNLSFMLDLTIFFKTFVKVLKSEGVNKTGSVTTEYFNGNN